MLPCSVLNTYQRFLSTCAFHFIVGLTRAFGVSCGHWSFVFRAWLATCCSTPLVRAWFDPVEVPPLLPYQCCLQRGRANRSTSLVSHGLRPSSALVPSLAGDLALAYLCMFSSAGLSRSGGDGLKCCLRLLAITFRHTRDR